MDHGAFESNGQVSRHLNMGGKLSVLLKSWQKAQRHSAANQLTGHKANCVENLVSRCTDLFLDLAQAHIDEIGTFDDSGPIPYAIAYLLSIYSPMHKL